MTASVPVASNRFDILLHFYANTLTTTIRKHKEEVLMANNEITVAETARQLHVELNYVYSLLWAGKLEARKVNGQWRISSEAVEDRLKARA